MAGGDQREYGAATCGHGKVRVRWHCDRAVPYREAVPRRCVAVQPRKQMDRDNQPEAALRAGSWHPVLAGAVSLHMSDEVIEEGLVDMVKMLSLAHRGHTECSFVESAISLHRPARP